jgi:Mor family transcriptional regulator
MRDYTNSEIRHLVDEHIHNERDRAILKRRFCDGIRYEALAEEYDLSTQRVKTIVARAKSSLFVD